MLILAFFRTSTPRSRSTGQPASLPSIASAGSRGAVWPEGLEIKDMWRHVDAPGILRAGPGASGSRAAGSGARKCRAERAPGGRGTHTGHAGATRHRGKAGAPGSPARARGLGSLRAAAAGARAGQRARWGGGVRWGKGLRGSRRRWREQRVSRPGTSARRRPPAEQLRPGTAAAGAAGAPAPDGFPRHAVLRRLPQTQFCSGHCAFMKWHLSLTATLGDVTAPVLYGRKLGITQSKELPPLRLVRQIRGESEIGLHE